MRFHNGWKVARIFLVLVLPGWLGAETVADKAGSVAFKFLNLHYGARGAALGGLSAQAAGADAVFWNPAGLAATPGVGLSASATRWLVDTNYLNASVALPLAGGVVGVSFLSVDYGDLLKSGWSGETEFVFDANQGTFSASDVAFQVSYGRLMSGKFSVGGTAKVITEKIDTETVNGFAFDVGTQFNTGYRGIRLGAVISNFGPDIQPVSIPAGFTYSEFPSMSLPMTFSFGIIGHAFGDEGMGLVTGVNVVKYADMTQRFAFNGEFTVAGLAKVRGSYTFDAFGGDAIGLQSPLSVGAGLNVAGISVDLAISVMNDFDAVTRISVGYQL